MKHLSGQSPLTLKALALRSFLALLFILPFTFVLFYQPLFEKAGSIQWDAVDVHFYNLQFSSATWHSGVFPLWTPYLFGGFPQVADLQVAFFYPVNFVISLFAVFTPDLLMDQLVFHYILAGLFAFWLALYLSKSFWFSLAAGLSYAFGGFMVGHASHVGIQNSAAWVPIIAVLLFLTFERRQVIFGILCGLCFGIAILAGHFQTSLYIGYMIVTYWIFSLVWRNLSRWTWKGLRGSLAHYAGLLFVIGATAFMISAVQLLPTYELASQSVRESISLEMSQTESLDPASLPALLISNYNNVSFGDYQGPWDRTENYLYVGVAILGLAALGSLSGMRSPQTRKMTVFWTVFLLSSLLYSFGKFSFVQPFFYQFVPLFDKVRAPANMMLMVTLSLIGLASVGFVQGASMLAQWLAKVCRTLGREPSAGAISTILPRVSAVTSFVFFLLVSGDILGAVLPNRLLYARRPPESIVQPDQLTSAFLADYAHLQETSRFRVWHRQITNSAQIFGIFDFAGYNPLELQRHVRYAAVMLHESRLIDLAGIKELGCDEYPGCVNEHYFPRAFLVEQYQVAASPDEALDALTKIDPEKTVVLEKDPLAAMPPSSIADQNVNTLTLKGTKPGYWELSSEAHEYTFLVLTETSYPGWSASIDGQPTSVFRADYLFQGVLVPPGTHKVIFSFDSVPFKVGLALTLFGVGFTLVCALLFSRPRLAGFARRSDC